MQHSNLREFDLSALGYQVVIFFVSIAYAFLLASLPLEAFKDRGNYLVYATSPIEILSRYVNDGGVSFAFNEPVWLLINIGLSSFLAPENVLRVLIFVPAFVTSFLVLRYSPRHWPFLLAFLFAPQVIKNNIIHLRQGVAISVFLFGWFAMGNKRLLFFFLAPFIHSSFFFVIMLLFFSRIFACLRFAYDIRTIFYVVLALVVGVGLSFIASILGARQANGYEFTAANVSGLGFVFWFGVLVLCFMEGRDFLNRYSFSIGVLLFYLTTYFLIEISARIFESAMLLVLLACLSLTSWRGVIFILAFAGYLIFGYYLRLDQPGLGWGLID